MLEMMEGYYTSLKSEVGIEDQDKLDEDDTELDEILRTLKPNTTPENFKDFLVNTSSVNRNKAWRDIYRKLKPEKKQVVDYKIKRGDKIDPKALTTSALVNTFVTEYTAKNQGMDLKQKKILGKLNSNNGNFGLPKIGPV